MNQQNLRARLLAAATTAISILMWPSTLLAKTDSSIEGITAESCRNAVPPPNVLFIETPEWISSNNLPIHCQIRGLAAGKVRFVMKLPQEWKGRFLLTGCGGFCGELLPDRENRGNGINHAVRRGYAAIAHDGGHTAPSWDTSWASDADALDIWAHRILPMMTSAGVELARSVYGVDPAYKYFSGCSNGGRLGVLAAQRYPGLFDGIAAGGSIIDLGGIAGLWGSWMTSAITRDDKPVIAPARWANIHQKILRQCDSLDGRSDQRIDSPRQCTVNFDSFLKDKEPLTNSEVEALKALYSGVRDAKGDIIYPSMEYGAEVFGDIWLGGSEERKAWGVLASEGYRDLLAMSLGKPAKSIPAKVDVVIPLIQQSALSGAADAKNPDLRPHARTGSKLLVYHGLADPLIIPQPVEDYYAAAAKSMGGIDKLREHARLFMIPGWGHCWERPTVSSDDFDPLATVEAWVERSEPPDYLVINPRDPDKKFAVPMR